jgi:hypothetical protein
MSADRDLSTFSSHSSEYAGRSRARLLPRCSENKISTFKSRYGWLQLPSMGCDEEVLQDYG